MACLGRLHHAARREELPAPLGFSRIGQTCSTKGRSPRFFVLRFVTQALWALPALELPPGREPAVLWMEVEVKSTSQAPPTPVEVAPGHSQEDAREIPNLGNQNFCEQNWGDHGAVAFASPH